MIVDGIAEIKDSNYLITYFSGVVNILEKIVYREDTIVNLRAINIK